MAHSNPARMTLRPAALDDCRSLWIWRNEATTREASINMEVISYEDHEKWFSRKLESQDTQIFILVNAFCHSIGYVRFYIEGDEAEISVSVDEAERGQGYGSAGIRQASDRLISSGLVKRIIAHIKPDNLASLTSFRRAGYGPTESKAPLSRGAYVMLYE